MAGQRYDVVIVGVPHSAYKGLVAPAGVEVLDVWGIIDGGSDRVQPATEPGAIVSLPVEAVRRHRRTRKLAS